MELTSVANRYYAFFLARCKNYISYRMDALFSLLFRVVYPVLMVVLWSAIYSNSGASVINGYTLNQIYSYFFFAAVLNLVTFGNVVWTINDHVKEGDIYRYLVKPVSYPKVMLVERLAASTLDLLLIAVPIMAIGYLSFHIHVSAATAVILVVEVLIAQAISFFIGVSLGCLAFYLTDAYGIAGLSNWLIWVFGGGGVPLSMFPAWLGNILTLLPMQLIMYLPAATLAGTLSMQFITTDLEVGIFWVVVMGLLANWVWEKSKRHVSVVGV